MRIGFLAAAGLALGAVGCAGSLVDLPGAGQSELAGEPVALVRFEDAPRFWSGMEQRERRMVETRAEWEAVWSRVVGSYHPAPTAPPVDFAREVVVVVAMGVRPSTGYSIAVTAAARSGGQTTLRVVETSPGRRCGVGAALTQPVDLVRLPRSALPLRFSEGQAIRDC